MTQHFTHVRTEAHKSRNKNMTKKKKTQKTKQKTLTQTSVFEISGRKIIIIIKKKGIFLISGKSFGWLLFELGLKCVQSDRFLWTWHLQNGLVAPALSHKVDICHGRHWEEQTAQVSNCAESPGAFPPGDRICLEGG